MTRRIHYLQHVRFEGPANIALWAAERGDLLTGAELYAGDPLPGVDDFDWLIVLGGPMSVGDEDAQPWLVEEKRLIGAAINSGKPVFGICLGAQLIANVLGAKVYPNRFKEIGWFPVSLTAEARALSALEGWPPVFMPFHWHADTFDIPDGAVRLAESEACRNQGFIYGSNVFALQFHLETSIDSIEKLVANCGDDSTDAPYVQHPAELARADKIAEIRPLLNSFLDAWAKSLYER